MITMLIWSLFNGFFFHIDTKFITEDMRILMTTIGLASDLNMLVTGALIEIVVNFVKLHKN